MERTDALVEIRDVRFVRGRKVILDGVDLDVVRGKITVIMGPNGVGKSTLLALIGGQLRPTAGRIMVDGKDVHRLRHNQLYRLRKRMGMLFQRGRNRRSRLGSSSTDARCSMRYHK